MDLDGLLMSISMEKHGTSKNQMVDSGCPMVPIILGNLSYPLGMVLICDFSWEHQLHELLQARASDHAPTACCFGSVARGGMGRPQKGGHPSSLYNHSMGQINMSLGQN
jgi:hypothetical protein